MDKHIIVILAVFSLISLVMLNIIGCSNTPQDSNSSTLLSGDADTLAYQGEQHRVVKFSEEKKYIASLYTDALPIPVGRIHHWILDVRTADGQPLENVKIYVHGGMPAHQHGFPTHPRISQYLGNGRYIVDGVKFSMTGDWQMRFNIKEEKQRDRAIFNIKL